MKTWKIKPYKAKEKLKPFVLYEFYKDHYYLICSGCKELHQLNERWKIVNNDGVPDVQPTKPLEMHSIQFIPCGGHFWIKKGITELADDNKCFKIDNSKQINYKRTMKVTVYKSKKEWRWKIVAGNGENVACSSEGFSSERNCRKNMELTLQALQEELVERPAEESKSDWRG